MKEGDLNYISANFHGHTMASLGLRGRSFHPDMASKMLKSQKNPSFSKIHAEDPTLNFNVDIISFKVYPVIALDLII